MTFTGRSGMVQGIKAGLLSFHQLQFHFMTIDGRPIRSQVPLHVTRGIFMAFIRDVDPGLASKVHGAGGTPTYTTQLDVRGRDVYLTFNLFSRVLNDAVKSFILQRDDMRFQLGRIPVLLVKIQVRKVHVGDIIDGSRAIRSFKITFRTPLTLYRKPWSEVELKRSTGSESDGTDGHDLEGAASKKRTRKVLVPWPEPSLLFQNVARMWNELTGDVESIDTPAFISWVGSHVFVTSHELKTGGVSLGSSPGNRRVTGFRGWARFKVVGEGDSAGADAENAKLVDRLLHFAEYCNVGSNRTMGMGAVRVKVN
ncbi:MAG: CRISPR system precrRNA processing endoribonuclease RAMP protein Cas6 [Promethearchaeota archaeon]